MRTYANRFSDAYTDSSKKTHKAISRISVHTTLVRDGVVEDQAYDSRTNSSFANASAKAQRRAIPTNYPTYGRSSHEYHNTGAQSIYHTTQANR